MARLKRRCEPTGRVILLVDDNVEYLEATRRVIEREGHEVLIAPGGADGLTLLRERDVDLVLLDFHMPGMSGEEFVREMRRFRPSTQVILQTGYASEHPPREMIRRLDIQGYHDKSDGADKLVLWIDVGLKAAFAMQLIEKSRLGLRYVLRATPELHRLQPLEDLLQGVLLQCTGLLGATDAFVASANAPAAVDAGGREGFVATVQDEELHLRAGTGRFRSLGRLEDHLGGEDRARVSEALRTTGVACLREATLAALRVGSETVGAVYIDRAATEPWQRELVEVFANQAAVAIQNTRLHDLAALDALTGVSARAFFQQALSREIRMAGRTGASVGLLMIDVDAMKAINDRHSHLAGDRALAAVGRALRRLLRSTDLIGRIGGDEFAAVLPATDAEGARVVAERLRAAFAGEVTAELDGQSFAVRASIGAAVLPGGPATHEPARIAPEVVESTMESLYAAADQAMYRHKRERDATVAIVAS